MHAIAQGKTGELYVGNQQGLFRLLGANRELQRVSADKISFPVFSLAADSVGNMWAGTRQGLFRFNEKSASVKQILLGSDVLSRGNEVTGVYYEPSTKGLWLISPAKVSYYNPAADKMDHYPGKFRHAVNCFDVAGDVLYIGTEGHGVLPFNLKTRTYLPPVSFGNNIISAISHTPDGRLIVATDGEGLFVYDRAQRRITDNLTSENSGMRSNSVYSLFIDKRGLWWIGYYQAGVDYTPAQHRIFEVYTTGGNKNLSRTEVRAIAFGDGFKLIGTRNGLFQVNERTGTVTEYSKPTLRSNVIFAIQKWGHLYYIGTYGGGLYTLDPATMRLVSAPLSGKDSGNTTVFDLTVDAQGNLWAATSEGAYRMGARGDTRLFDSNNSRLPDGNVYDIYFDSTGRGWISTENGMALWNGREIRTDGFPKNFIHNQKIRDVFEDSDHNLYFAPDRGRVVRANSELTKIEQLTSGVDVSNSFTTFIIEDSDGWLWFGTDRGLVRYDRKDRYTHYGLNEGLPNPIFTLCRPIKDANGNLWMGNSNGLVMLSDIQIRNLSGKIQPTMTITKLVSNKRDITRNLENRKGEYRLVLPSDCDDLTISVTDFSYSRPEMTTVEYMLEGNDEDWQTTTALHNIHYYNLVPGKYTLRIRRPGDPTTETRVQITKRAGIMWFALIAVVLIIVVGGVVIWYVSRSRRMRREELELTLAAQAAAACATGQDDHDNRGDDKKKSAARVPYRTTRLTDEECKRLARLLDKVMRDKRPYINPDLKIGDLAELADTSAHALSFFFNQYLGKSYYDYVNNFRVGEFKRLVKETDMSKYTLSAMAARCGFSSRASFFRHFKAITGITPSEYLKQKS